MKVFLQAKDERIIINGDITVTVLAIEGDEVRWALTHGVAFDRGRSRAKFGKRRGSGSASGPIILKTGESRRVASLTFAPRKVASFTFLHFGPFLRMIRLYPATCWLPFLHSVEENFP